MVKGIGAVAGAGRGSRRSEVAQSIALHIGHWHAQSHACTDLDMFMNYDLHSSSLGMLGIQIPLGGQPF